MIFNPDSTFSTVKEDISLLKELSKFNGSTIMFTKMLPYAGTTIARRMKEEGRLIGTLASPDYEYLDPRLDLLQCFCSQAFHTRNFVRNGLAERLRYTMFDAIINNKFNPDKYDTQSYLKAVKKLV